jgi:hypothetical protein
VAQTSFGDALELPRALGHIWAREGSVNGCSHRIIQGQGGSWANLKMQGARFASDLNIPPEVDLIGLSGE